MVLLKIIFLLASFWATLATAGNENRDQDLFWAARGKKASLDENWQDSVIVEPLIAALVDKRDGSVVPFWAARGKKYAVESGDGLPFWAARGKKGAIERRDEPMPFWAARGKRIPSSEMLNEDEEEASRREKRSIAEREASVLHSGQRFRNRPVRPAPQATEPFWAARGKKNSEKFQSPLF